jgi:hypothetical protein
LRLEEAYRATVIVFDPVGEPAIDDVQPVPRLDSRVGKKLGIVVDGNWQSWPTIVERLEEIVQAQERPFTIERFELNAKESMELSRAVYNRGAARVAEEARDAQDKSRLPEFADGVDAVIVGLAN